MNKCINKTSLHTLHIKDPQQFSINPKIYFIYPTVNNIIPNKIRINPETKKQT
jgi:hypothetical protein